MSGSGSTPMRPKDQAEWPNFAWVALGVPALFPVCYIAVFIVVVLMTVGLDGRDPSEPDVAATLRPFHIAAAVFTGLALAACLAHLKRAQPDASIRRRKAARLIIGSVFVIPFYWWNEMRLPRSPDGRSPYAPRAASQNGEQLDPSRRRNS